MRINWTGANIVLPAQNHNPSILSPDWIQQHHIIEETREDFVHTPVFSLYRSITFQLMVDPERLRLSLRVLSPVNLQALQGAISTCVQSLPHVPYRAVGLNFAWIATADEPGEGFRLMERLFLSKAEQVRSAFPEGELRLGAHLYNVTQEYRLRVLVQPKLETDGNLGLDFNYHFDTSSSDAALKAASRLSDCFSNARSSSERLLGFVIDKGSDP